MGEQVICLNCGRPNPSGTSLCDRCRERRPGVERARGGVIYQRTRETAKVRRRGSGILVGGVLFLAALIFAGGTLAVFMGGRPTSTDNGIAFNPSATASRLEIFEQQTATPSPTPELTPEITPWFPSPTPTIDPALITPDPAITATPVTPTDPGQVTPRPTRTPRPNPTPTKTPKPTPTKPPATQAPPDSDGDRIPDASDNCRDVPNRNQANMDGDEFGDKCDADRDGDNVANDIDNCPNVKNRDQLDADKDGTGDACDPADPPTPGGTPQSPGPEGSESPAPANSPAISPSASAGASPAIQFVPFAISMAALAVMEAGRRRRSAR